MVIKPIVQKKTCLLTMETETWISCSVFLITKSLTLDTYLMTSTGLVFLFVKDGGGSCSQCYLRGVLTTQKPISIVIPQLVLSLINI